jgi:predicted GNAT family acetyltransferase
MYSKFQLLHSPRHQAVFKAPKRNPMLEIKPFDPHSDYPRLTAIQNAVFSDELVAPQTCHANDQNLPKHILQHRWMVWLAGQAVGFAESSQNPEHYHPQRLELSVMVAPTFRQRGVGTARYNQLVKNLVQFKPIAF